MRVAALFLLLFFCIQTYVVAKVDDVTILLFGASGDLAKRSLIPALYQLFAQKKITKFALIGTARTKLTAAEMLERGKKFIPNLNPDLWQNFSRNAFYYSMDASKPEDFSSLKNFIEEVEQKKRLSGNRLVYCSTASTTFEEITENCLKAGIIHRPEKGKGWCRVAYEKPLGTNLHTAQNIANYIKKRLDPSQIYLVDHYLGKELVQNIPYIRATNPIIEALWNNKYIESVTILLNEERGIENRGSFYDSMGAITDVVQNHLFQLFTLVALDLPHTFTFSSLADAKIAVLKKVQFVNGALGQYQGYRKEDGVSPTSSRETFAALVFKVDNERWKGVPFLLQTGKWLTKKDTRVIIKYKPAAAAVIREHDGEANMLQFQIDPFHPPHSGINMTLNIKGPGLKTNVSPHQLVFCYPCTWPNTPLPYAALLEHMIRGSQALSVHLDEITAAWKIIDQVKKAHLPLYVYEKGTDGPAAASALLQKPPKKIAAYQRKAKQRCAFYPNELLP